MIRHLLKLVWNRKGANALITLEIFLSLLVAFALVETLSTSWIKFRRPLGFEIANLWRVETRIDPRHREDPALRNRFGTMLMRSGQEERAREEYETAVAYDSCFVPALFNLAVIYSDRGNTERALILARRAGRLRPDLIAVTDFLSQLERESAPDSAR